MSDHLWPDAPDLLQLLSYATGPGDSVRDAGILVAAAMRPNAAILGTVIYPTLLEKSAALLHAIVVWRPLQVWNVGLGWAAALGLLMRNGFDPKIPALDHMKITDQIIRGELDDVTAIARRLRPYLRTR